MHETEGAGVVDRDSRAEPLVELARAKLNLSLTVRGRRADGYHVLESLVVFADEAASDRLELSPGGRFALHLCGPGKTVLSADAQGTNLIECAVIAVARAAPHLVSGTFVLEKRLPIAAGIGGGSADAAATLRLLQKANPELAGSIAWAEIAATIGADVPVCLESRASVMAGIGEHVTPLDGLPSVWAVLANPRVPLETARVFRLLSAAPLGDGVPPEQVPSFATSAALIAHLRRLGNDLEQPAKLLCPEIGDVLSALSRLEGAELVRMSGSGPTCFALFADAAAAERGALELQRARPQWWVRATKLC